MYFNDSYISVIHIDMVMTVVFFHKKVQKVSKIFIIVITIVKKYEIYYEPILFSKGIDIF